MRILLLGGTSEASELARALAQRGADAVFSYAGRTARPVAQPLPTRVGGFGGCAGLQAFLQAENVRQVIDATHPFASGMSRNAQAACAALGVDLVTYQRPPWQAGAGDIWHHVSDMQAAVAALPEAPARVFLAIGKQALALFSARSQHRYLLRLVDAPQDVPLRHWQAEIARGPFDVPGDIALMRAHRIQLIVAKNAGGDGAMAKLVAARELGLPVILVDRPVAPAGTVLTGLEQVLHWLDHPERLGV